jgi:hypothetical protein
MISRILKRVRAWLEGFVLAWKKYANMNVDLKEIKPPVTLQETEQLVKIFPETTLYEVEWILLHLFESVFTRVNGEEYVRLIGMCPRLGQVSS